MLPQIVEREYRFKLALRMVLPIFALVLSLILQSFTSDYYIQSTSFYIETILILLFSTYFIFYLIYKGFDTKITDDVSKAFTREYLYKYLQKKLKKTKEYTFMLVSIDNLNEINSRYGIKNGDKILFETVKWIGNYLKEKNISNFPIGHIKGGDFIIGLDGSKNKYKTVLELMCLKIEGFRVDDIEIEISGAINDIALSKEINYIIENLFELQNENRNTKHLANTEDEIDPNELESYVISAIKRRDFLIVMQDVFEKDVAVIKECFVKLKTTNGKLLHQKSYMKALDKLRLMVDYDLIILEKVIDRCIESGTGIFAITVSPTSLRNQLFLNSAKELFKRNESAKKRVIFLVCENEYYPRIDKFNANLQELRKSGVIIAIDRLGSIHTSFTYSRDLEIDIVRFDSFYSKNINNEKYKNIIDGFNIMAHNNGIKTWIKMVENEDINYLSKELEINYLQGRYLADLEKS